MAGIVIFAPNRAGDALEQSRWMAKCTVAALEAQSRTLDTVLDAQANRDNLQAALSRGGEGVAFFAHGRDSKLGSQRLKHGELPKDDAILGADKKPALDRENIASLAGRWVHAVVCRSGSTDLPGLAIDSGAQCYAGYAAPIYVGWSFEEIPEAIRSSLEALVTSTTQLLARGERDQRALRRAARSHADAIQIWCDEHSEDLDIAPWVMTARGLARVILTNPPEHPAQPA